MKLFLVLIFGLIVAPGSYAQDKEMKSNDKKDQVSWEDAKEAYHEIMSSTFHPAEEGDFKPLKERYQELAMRAKDWRAVAIPDDLADKDLDKILEKLHKKSSKVGELIVAGASDEDLKKSIFALHDVFHKIVGLCSH